MAKEESTRPVSAVQVREFESVRQPQQRMGDHQGSTKR